MPQIFIATIITSGKVVQIIPVCLFEAVLCYVLLVGIVSVKMKYNNRTVENGRVSSLRAAAAFTIFFENYLSLLTLCTY